MIMYECKSILKNSDMAVCRLCSGREEILDVFRTELTHPQQLRLSIFLATGIQIKETDTVSKMVCHRCCEIAVKLHMYRLQAVSNDKLLKEKYGQSYEPPIVNQDEIVRQASIIVSEQMLALDQSRDSTEISDTTYQSIVTNTQEIGIIPFPAIGTVPDNDSCTNQDFQDKGIPKVLGYKHSSVHELCNRYESIILPEEMLKSDISPVISLNSLEVADWYANQAKVLQERLKNVVIKKVSSGSASANPSIVDPKPNIVDPKPNIEDPKPNIEDSKPNIEDSKPNIEDPKPNIDDPQPDIVDQKPIILPVPLVPSSSDEPHLPNHRFVSSDYSDLTTSNNDIVNVDKDKSNCKYRKENDASKINIMRNTPVFHAHIQNKETPREGLQHSVTITKTVSPIDNSKSVRKLLSLRRGSVYDGDVSKSDDDVYEVTPKKKNKYMNDPDWRRKNKTMAYKKRHIEILPTPQTVVTQAPQSYYDMLQREMNSFMDTLTYDSSVPSPTSSAGHQNQSQRRMRTSFKHHQLKAMQSYFAINKLPHTTDLKHLAQKTGLPLRVLQVWFQNARAKWRRSLMRQEGGTTSTYNGQETNGTSLIGSGSAILGHLNSLPNPSDLENVGQHILLQNAQAFNFGHIY